MKQVYPVFIVRDGEDFLVNVPDMEILTEELPHITLIAVKV